MPVGTNNSMKVKTLRRAVEEHGEIHCVVEEVAAEVEVRKGTANWYPADNTFSVFDGTTRHHFDADSVVSFYKPMEVFHV